MSDQFVGEIRIVPFNFAPTGWAFCDGQLLPISQNTALFALLGTFYGGNGQSTFALPNLQGAAPLAQGQGQGLSEYSIGQTGGSSTVTLLASEIPFHTHTVSGLNATGDQSSPADGSPAAVSGRRGETLAYTSSASGGAIMGGQALAIAGGGLPHNNMPPYLTLNFVVALQGIFPQRP